MTTARKSITDLQPQTGFQFRISLSVQRKRANIDFSGLELSDLSSNLTRAANNTICAQTPNFSTTTTGTKPCFCQQQRRKNNGMKIRMMVMESVELVIVNQLKISLSFVF